MRKLDVWGNTINITQHIDLSLWSFVLVRDLCNRSQRVAPIDQESEFFQGQKQSDSKNLHPASKEMISDSVELCETEVCFLHIQLIGTNVMTSKNAQCSTRSRFRVFKISCKIGFLKQSQSALFSSIPHPILCHPHTQIRIILFHDERRDIPNLKFSPIHVSMRTFSNCPFP